MKNSRGIGIIEVILIIAIVSIAFFGFYELLSYNVWASSQGILSSPNP